MKCGKCGSEGNLNTVRGKSYYWCPKCKDEIRPVYSNRLAVPLDYEELEKEFNNAFRGSLQDYDPYKFRP